MSEIIGASERAGLESGQGTERPLTDEERATVTRLLGDPFSFPMVFKTWLISFLEGSDLLLARSSVQGLSDLLGSGGGAGVMGLLPAGLIFPYGGSAAPTGALLCNGAAYSRTGYKRLFDAIGVLYGAGDGSTTFNVPDMRRRLPFGQGAGLGLGASDGRAEGSRHIDHHHTFGQTSGGGGAHDHGGGTSTDGSHSHGNDAGQIARTSLAQMANPGAGPGRYVIDGTTVISSAGSHSHSIGTDTAPDHTHFVSGDTTGAYDRDRPSFLTVGYIINY